MEEVKFRVWDGEKMITEKVVYFGEGDFAIDECGMVWSFDFDTNFIGMQYTCLKDKNGNEAYEGDWVKPKSGNFVTGQIIKWKGAFWVEGKNKRGDSGRDLLAYYPEFTIETNVYQNPELVEEQQ
tara:strand:- start:1515 stop:1889 length:375 start_codon:yes stop_codon:yes gene_type:complete